MGMQESGARPKLRSQEWPSSISPAWTASATSSNARTCTHWAGSGVTTAKRTCGNRRLVDLVDPGHLDRLQDLLPAALRIVVEIVQLLHPLKEIGKAHRQRIDAGMRFGERDRDVQGVGPFHFPASFTMLIVYFGISMVRSLSLTIAWHESRELRSSPQALSRRSSSSSSEGSSVSKPSRTITWQVVQAQDFSQACSISTSFCSRLSQTETPGFASMTAPSGHRSAWGRTMICGMEA